MLSDDLWKLTALSLTALVGIVSFAAGMRPLAGGQLSPADALRYMALATIPMLQFTTPFAAGFAATLVYHRFAVDNEHLAVSSGGISHRSILTPALTVGVVLTLVVAGLSNFVIPTFVRSMQRLITRDVGRLLTTSIQNGDAVELNGLVIHADRAISGLSDASKGELDRIFLTGVVAFDTTEDGAISAEVAAEHAEVLLTRERINSESMTVVRMRLDGAVGKQQGQGIGEVGAISIGPWLIPNAFRDSPQLYTFTQLRALRNHPERNSEVDLFRRRLAGMLTQLRAERLLKEAVVDESRVVAVDSLGRRLAISASGVERDGDRWRLIPAGADGIRIDQLLADGSRRSQTARSAWITVHAEDSPAPASITLELEEVASEDRTGATREKLKLDQLHLSTDPGGDLYALSTQSLLTRSQLLIEGSAPAPEIAALALRRDTLTARIARLKREIVGNHNERFALASACLLMTLSGAILALRLRDGAPLQVYLWSFFPALGSVITISGGENAVAESQTFGLIILWGGVGAMALYTLYEYVRLHRH